MKKQKTQKPIAHIHIDNGFYRGDKYCCDVYIQTPNMEEFRMIIDEDDMEEFNIEHSSFRNGVQWVLHHLGYEVHNESGKINTPPTYEYNEA